jgi:two-component system, sensor histidine kinase
VVDDHPLGRQALTVLLGLRGLEVRACAGGEAALQALAEQPFDLVLSDLNMAGLDGREMTRRLRAAPGPNRRTPVLAVTGEAGEDALRACVAAGMDALVTKPLEPRALYEAVERVLEESRSESRAESAGASLSSHSQTVSTRQPASARA